MLVGASDQLLSFGAHVGPRGALTTVVCAAGDLLGQDVAGAGKRRLATCMDGTRTSNPRQHGAWAGSRIKQGSSNTRDAGPDRTDARSEKKRITPTAHMSHAGLYAARSSTSGAM